MILKEDRGHAENWVLASRKGNSELFSEVDVLLRSLERFFTIENVRPSQEEITAANFSDDLITVRDAILRLLGILEVIIPDSRKNVYWFQKFAETKLLTADRRDAFRENLYRQDTPEKSLYLLYDTCINLKGIVSDLLQAGNISYLSFMNIGRLISKEIRENRFFNPFRKGLNPEYDFIGSREISEIVKAVSPKEFKKEVSLIYIYLFRFLRFLSFVDIATRREVTLNSSLMILSLVRSEINIFIGFLDKTVKASSDKVLAGLLRSAAYQFSMESKRVFSQELRDIYKLRTSPHFRGKIENSHGILKNLTEQVIVQLTQFFNPDVKGEAIFPSFVTRLQQSVMLREDAFVLHEFVWMAESAARNVRQRVAAFESLRNYMVYFEGSAFRLLRYGDYEEFASFFQEVNLLPEVVAEGPGFYRAHERIKQFRVFLELTLRNIENRAELSGGSFDNGRIETMIKKYLRVGER
ncbi:MAG: hypothetical protein P8013_07105 [Candidatus Sulfobium sp.]